MKPILRLWGDVIARPSAALLRAALATLAAGFAVTAEGQVRTEFDGRVRPSSVALQCQETFAERDVKRARSDARGSFVSVMETVGEWIRHGYTEVQSGRDGDRVVKSYARDFKVRVNVNAGILNLDTRPFERHATVVYQWQRPRYDVDTNPAAMESYASGETKERMRRRTEAIKQRWSRDLESVGRALDAMSFQYNAGELARIRAERNGSFSHDAHLAFCNRNHPLSLDVRWRSFVPGGIGGEGRP